MLLGLLITVAVLFTSTVLQWVVIYRLWKMLDVFLRLRVTVLPPKAKKR